MEVSKVSYTAGTPSHHPTHWTMTCRIETNGDLRIFHVFRNQHTDQCMSYLNYALKLPPHYRVINCRVFHILHLGYPPYMEVSVSSCRATPSHHPNLQLGMSLRKTIQLLLGGTPMTLETSRWVSLKRGSRYKYISHYIRFS